MKKYVENLGGNIWKDRGVGQTVGKRWASDWLGRWQTMGKRLANDGRGLAKAGALSDG